jgi:hypothetical protein
LVWLNWIQKWLQVISSTCFSRAASW